MWNWKEYPKSRQMYEDAKQVFAMGVGSQVQSFNARGGTESDRFHCLQS